MNRRIVLAAVLSCLLVSCSGEKREVKNLVITYNRVLQEAYLKPKPRLMEHFTSDREFRQIDTYIQYLYKNNKILKCELREMIFEAVRIEGDTATAVTRERWIYSYLDPASRAPVSGEYDVLYSNIYRLAKKDGRWVVDGLESRETGGTTEG